MWRFLLGAAALAVAPPPYTDTNSEVALRNLSAISAKDPGALSDSEGVEWVRARFAWIALLRLEGDEPAALAVFSGCKEACGKWGSTSEWAALKKWGCAREKASFCK